MQIPFRDSSTNGYWRSVKMYNENVNVSTDNALASNQIIPSVIGYGLKDAIYMLENLGLKVKPQGKGKVIYQSVAAGTNFNKGQKIELQLN